MRAKLRAMVKRILRKYGYPPDKQEKATLTVLEQAELLRKDVAAQGGAPQSDFLHLLCIFLTNCARSQKV